MVTIFFLLAFKDQILTKYVKITNLNRFQLVDLTMCGASLSLIFFSNNIICTYLLKIF